MKVRVVLLPSMLVEVELRGKAVVVLDVLRATTTIAAALAAGISSIRVFADLDQARRAAEQHDPDRRPLLCGEVHALAPPGFDLGNSPRQFLPQHRSRPMILSTTNGTKALAAAASAGAQTLLAAALVNASAAARALAKAGQDAVLLCSGSGGKIAVDDLIGAGAIACQLINHDFVPEDDEAIMAMELFDAVRGRLPQVLRQTSAGKNILRANLEADIDFAAKVDSLDVVGAVNARDLTITAI